MPPKKVGNHINLGKNYLVIWCGLLSKLKVSHMVHLDLKKYFLILVHYMYHKFPSHSILCLSYFNQLLELYYNHNLMTLNFSL